MFDYYDTLITPEEAAELLGCGMNTIYKILRSGKLKAMRIGRIWKIPRRAVQEYMCQGKMPPSVRERYMKMKVQPEHPENIDALIENFDRALSHPDGNDLERLRKIIVR